MNSTLTTQSDNQTTAGSPGRGTTPFGLEVVADYASMVALNAGWEDLTRRAGATIFQSFHWQSLWWKHFGEHASRTLHIVVVRAAGELVAICPFFVEDHRFLGVSVRRVLRLMGSGVGHVGSHGLLSVYGPSDYLDAIVDTRHHAPVAALLAEHVRANNVLVDELIFEHVKTDSFIAGHLLPELARLGIQSHSEESDICPRLSLPESVEGFLAGRDSSTRRRLGQARKAIGELFEVRQVQSPGECSAAMDDLIALHQRRWNELGFAGLFSESRFTAFHRELAEVLLGEGLLCLKTAHADGSCVAVRLLYRYHGTYFDYLSGFDDHAPVAKRRPGVALLISAMEDAIREGCRTLDFLRGDERYKFDFTETSGRNIKARVQLRSRQSSSHALLAVCFELFTRLRYHSYQERSLLAVQVRLKGAAKALPSYVAFRRRRFQEKNAAPKAENDVS